MLMVLMPVDKQEQIKGWLCVWSCWSHTHTCTCAI
jgi:hypothetical protein